MTITATDIGSFCAWCYAKNHIHIILHDFPQQLYEAALCVTDTVGAHLHLLALPQEASCGQSGLLHDGGVSLPDMCSGLMGRSSA